MRSASSTSLLLMMTLLLTSCDYSRYEQGYPISQQVLRQIESADLANASTTQPTTKPAPQNLLTTKPSEELVPPPPEKLNLTIEEVRQFALANNLDLKVELFNPTIAKESISEERARFESVFTAQANYQLTDSPTSTELAGSQTKGLSTNAGVQIPLRTGGVINLSLPIQRFETNNQFSTLNPAYTSDFAASISQPLLRGAGFETNSRGIRIATLQYQSTQARTKLEIIRVLADADRIYWRLYAARQELEVRKKEYDLAVAQLERARRQVKAEVAAEVEVVRAESGVADRIEGIITAENRVKQTERDLKRVINRNDLPQDSSTVIIPTSLPNALRYQLDRSLLVRVALNQRMEMLETELQIAQQLENIKQAQNDMLPLVSLDYTYNVNGLGPTLSNAFSVLGHKHFEDHTLGLRLEVPLGNEAARSRLRRAIATRLQSIATKDQRASTIQQEVLEATDTLETNWQRIVAAQSRVVLAARVVDAETRQFTQGLRTSTDVLDAQTRLANAQSSEISALTDYQIAQVDIAFASGTLLGAAKINWTPTTLPNPTQLP